VTKAELQQNSAVKGWQSWTCLGRTTIIPLLKYHMNYKGSCTEKKKQKKTKQVVSSHPSQQDRDQAARSQG